jgi:hypothetical protein
MDLARRQGAATCDQVSDALKIVRPERYFNYAMGLEPWLRDIVAVNEADVPAKLADSDNILTRCQRLGIEGSRLYGRQELLFR